MELVKSREGITWAKDIFSAAGYSYNLSTSSYNMKKDGQSIAQEAIEFPITSEEEIIIKRNLFRNKDEGG